MYMYTYIYFYTNVAFPEPGRLCQNQGRQHECNDEVPVWTAQAPCV